MEIKLIDEAYRKLKGSVYWDKTLSHLRTSIVEFESKNYNNKLRELYEALYDGNKWSHLSETVLDSINSYTFPKKIEKDQVLNGSPVVISNIVSKGFVIEEYNSFIELSIMGHLIGVLWILLIGHKIDTTLSDSCKGNRLCDTLIFRDGEATNSPNLFKPYYEQYSSWRNQGLDKADEAIKNNNNSVIISMVDLTRYFYNIRFSQADFDGITQKYLEEDIAISRINNLVYSILKKYSMLLGVEKDVLLPIGFLPSGILSNVYLDKFDKTVSSLNDTIYYGRYVDDIILVTKIPDETLRESILDQGIHKVSEYMINYLFINNVFCKEDDGYSLSIYKNLHVKESKLRFFYMDKEGYDIVIDTIKRDISNNTSEFNFLPEDMITDLQENVIKVERDDTVNKIRGVCGTEVDKYSLSKTIGKNLLLSTYADPENVSAFIEDLEHVLNHREIINNYLLWESILNYFVVNDRIDKIVNFSSVVIEAILAMDEEKNKHAVYEYLNRECVKSVKDTLLFTYYSCLIRATSIVWGKPIKDILIQVRGILSKSNLKNSCYAKLFTISNITKMRRMYCNSRMIRKSLLPISIEECMAYHKPNDSDDKLHCFYKLEEYFTAKSKSRFSKCKHIPYIHSPFEILYGELLKSIRKQCVDLEKDDVLLQEMFRQYAENFDVVPDEHSLRKGFEISRITESSLRIKINSVSANYTHNLEKLRIAIANVTTQESDLMDILKGAKRELSERCEHINKVMNEAIKEHSAMVVFPEAYIPLEYLQQLQKKSASSKMIIIGGIEHIKHGEKVYNFTVSIIPLTIKGVTYSIPFFHAKRYYSPAEKEVIENEHCIPVEGKENVLFDWKGMRFVTYCCYELTSIQLRSEYIGQTDMVIGVEWNKDINYFSNIMESLCRDLSCFCIQSNVSEYGDSRIVQPVKQIAKDIVKIKGGVNSSVIIGEVDIEALQKHNSSKGDGTYKVHPAGWKFAGTI